MEVFFSSDIPVLDLPPGVKASHISPKEPVFNLIIQ